LSRFSGIIGRYGKAEGKRRQVRNGKAEGKRRQVRDRKARQRKARQEESGRKARSKGSTDEKEPGK